MFNSLRWDPWFVLWILDSFRLRDVLLALRILHRDGEEGQGAEEGQEVAEEMTARFRWLV